MLNLTEFTDIKIIVGHTKTPFKLHRVVLATHSTFFRSALRPESLTEPNKLSEFSLPDISEADFTQVVEWIYKDTAEGINAHIAKYPLAISLYNTAETLGISTLRQYVSWKMLPGIAKHPHPAKGFRMLNTLYKHSTDGECLGFYEVGGKLLKDMPAMEFLELFRDQGWMNEKMKKDLPRMADGMKLVKQYPA